MKNEPQENGHESKNWIWSNIRLLRREKIENPIDQTNDGINKIKWQRKVMKVSYMSIWVTPEKSVSLLVMFRLSKFAG